MLLHYVLQSKQKACKQKFLQRRHSPDLDVSNMNGLIKMGCATAADGANPH